MKPRPAVRRATQAMLASLACLAGFFMLPLPAARASPSAKLVFARGAGTEACPDEAEFRAAVAARVGYDPFFPVAKRSVITRLDGLGADGFRARMEILDEGHALLGEKVFTSKDDCAELVRTLALAVSLAIDVVDAPAPEPSRDEPARGEPEPAPAPPATPSVAPSLDVVSPSPAAPARRSSDLRFEGSLGTVGSLGIARNASIGAVVGAAARRGPWSLGLEGRFDPSMAADVAPRGSVSTSLVGVSLLPCFATRWFVRACALATVGRLAVESSGIEHPSSDAGLFLAFGARAAFEMEASPMIALRVGLDLLAVPLRHAVRIGANDVYETSVIAGVAGIGGVVRF